MGNPKKPTDLGMNRTGVGTSPVDSQRTLEGALEGVPQPATDPWPIEDLRAGWNRDAEPVGSMPPPPKLSGIVRAVGQLARGHHPNVLLDKLSERLAFEATSVRLYEALIAKLAAA